MVIGGMRVIFTVDAMEDTAERTFPVSRHRSKRIHKKLVKRFGGEFRKRPCIFWSKDTIFAHPSFKAEFERQSVPLDDVTGNHVFKNLFGF